MEFNNDLWYFDKEKYTKEEAFKKFEEESGLENEFLLEDVKEGKICWCPNYGTHESGTYVDVTEKADKYKRAFPVWIIG
ncbi:MAG: hypothetical protein M0R51_12400 [Clostridia bacterium]|jgi:hypothetical protein|nr:hypothetical protein [Clostridia bacterium]